MSYDEVRSTTVGRLHSTEMDTPMAMENDSEDVAYELLPEGADVPLVGPGVIFEDDDGWDIMPYNDETLEKYECLANKVVNMGYLAYSSGNMYLYVDASRQWSLLMARDSLARLCGIIGAKNVSVSTSEAIEHYYPWLAKRCIANAALPLQRSICIGTRRLEVSLEGSDILFTRSRRIAEVPKHADERASEMCISPIMSTKLPRSWKWPGGGAIYNHIVPLFTDPRDMLTFMWHMGNSIIDPMQTPRCMMLAGPGGSGKSTILNTIINTMQGCSGALPDGTFTSHNSAVSEKVLKQLLSSRMVTCADVDLEGRKMDMHAVRTVASADYITVGAYRCLMRCSLTIASNGLMDPKTEYVGASDSIIRRMIVLYMDATASLLASEEAPQSQEARIDFACACAYVRLKHPHVPVTPRTVLLTIMGARYLQVKHMLEEADDPTIADYIAVASIVQAAAGIPAEDVGYKAYIISRDSVVEIGRRKFLKGIRPVPGWRNFTTLPA